MAVVQGMSFRSASDLITDMFTHAANNGGKIQTVGLFGPPGIGKTSIGEEVGRRMTAFFHSKPKLAPILGEGESEEVPVICLDLTSRLPEDIGGLPYRDGDEAKYASPHWAVTLSRRPGVLILDDLTAASPAIQAAARQIALDRRVHACELHPLTVIIVTGNRREDKSGATTLPAHFRNVTMLLQVEPDLKEWRQWYLRRPIQLADPVVAAFLEWKPEHFSQLPGKAAGNGAFATPRSWAMLGAILKGIQRHVGSAAAGLVGDGVGHEFAAFLQTRSKLVPPEVVLDDPYKAVPDPNKMLGRDIDKLVAMSSGLAEVATIRVRAIEGGDTETERIPGEKGNSARDRSVRTVIKLMRALHHTMQTNREYLGAGIISFGDASNSAAQFLYIREACMIMAAEERDPKNKDKPKVLAELVPYLKKAGLGDN